jgi:hypothetical protein
MALSKGNPQIFNVISLLTFMGLQYQIGTFYFCTLVILTVIFPVHVLSSRGVLRVFVEDYVLIQVTNMLT